METTTTERTNGAEKAALPGQQITIKPLNMETVELRIIGTSPYMQLRFSEKARDIMRQKMAEGQTAKKRPRSARDFDADYEASMYVTEDGRHGIPASAFRNAAIDACRMAGYQMTKAKCSIFVLAEAADAYDSTPLVILEGEPEKDERTVRNETGVADIRVRALWQDWSTRIVVRYDADQFRRDDVVNLFWRAGAQVGVGEGRAFSKKSNGIGFGHFELEHS